uniref:Uncharacterized protein n=2 Tax=Mycobacterium avium TaxID=1764 RepID=Q8GE81_MYCAV|nr:unknown [Mycobacterium avium subsp. hominissuis A5]
MGRSCPVQTIYRPPARASIPIAYDALNSGASHTGTAGATPILAIGTQGGSNVAATYGGVAMAPLASVTGSTYLFGLLGACTGTAQSIAITGSWNRIYYACASFKHVRSFGTPVTNSSTGTLAVPSAPSQFVVNAFSNAGNNGNSYGGYNQTILSSQASGFTANFLSFIMGYAAAGSPGLTFTVNYASSQAVAVPLNP